MDRRNGHLSSARRFLEAAREEFAVARPGGDEIKLRQVAEKGWGAAREGVKGLFYRRNLKVPRGTTKIQDRLRELSARDKAVATSRLYDSFCRYLWNLHVECFGDGFVSVKRIERDLRDLEDFLSTIERV